MAERKMTLAELQKRLRSLSDLKPAQSVIGIADPEVATYARVLEYGSIAGQPPWPAPGPRTLQAIDPESGAQVVISSQAPQGFIRVQAAQFADVQVQQLRSAVDWLDGDKVQAFLTGAISRASGEALELLRAAAPRDSERLAESLQVLSE